MAGKRDKAGASNATVIIRKVSDEEAEAHHGGAWKVAYADFVTAMMAFFLLMWLLNATTEDQRKGLADYFSPNNLLSHASSGTGQPFGGHTAFDEGALVSDRGAVQVTEGKRPPLDAVEDGDPQVFTRPRKAVSAAEEAAANGAPVPVAMQKAPMPPVTRDASAANAGIEKVGTETAGTEKAGGREPTQAEIAAEKERQEKAEFEKTANEIRDAVRNDPALAQFAKQLAIDLTPEGLRIQIMDEVKSAMFATGSAAPNDRARDLLLKIAPFLQKLPEQIAISGYTDAAPYAGPGKTNWELSSERANATRRLLTDGGLVETRVRRVTGHADRDPLLPGDPLAAANRRIAITVLRDFKAPAESQPQPAAATDAPR